MRVEMHQYLRLEDGTVWDGWLSLPCQAHHSAFRWVACRKRYPSKGAGVSCCHKSWVSFAFGGLNGRDCIISYCINVVVLWRESKQKPEFIPCKKNFKELLEEVAVITYSDLLLEFSFPSPSRHGTCGNSRGAYVPPVWMDDVNYTHGAPQVWQLRWPLCGMEHNFSPRVNVVLEILLVFKDIVGHFHAWDYIPLLPHTHARTRTQK